MYVEDLHIIKPSASGPYTTIQAAVQAALLSTPPMAVVITPEYAGTDTYTNPSSVPVIDLRPMASNTGSNLVKSITINGIPTGVQAVAAAAAPITGAAAANVFVTTLNLPSTPPINFSGIPFVVKANGYFQATAGTYTSTCQPLIYASTIAGFTASASAAIFSATAINVTVASASTKSVPWQIEAHMVCDPVSDTWSGFTLGSINNGTSLPIISNGIGTNGAANIAGATFTAAVPVQFLAGCTTTGAALGASAVVGLNQFFIDV
jgi:hypothetical protein